MKPGSCIRNDTAALSMPRGRRVGQPGHNTARKYLSGRMASIGLKPFSGDGFELPYQSGGYTDSIITFTNLVGMVPGRNPAEARPILIGAHYDSVIDAPCSDDNATAVAVALAIAEEAVRKPTGCDIVIALFDAEEPPMVPWSGYGLDPFFSGSLREH